MQEQGKTKSTWPMFALAGATLTIGVLSLNAQQPGNVTADKPPAPHVKNNHAELLSPPRLAEPAKHNSLESSGYTRPGNPSDEVMSDGTIRPAGSVAGGKFRIMGGTVYFAVFKNTGLAE